MTTPSVATFSPGRTTKTSPTPSRSTGIRDSTEPSAPVRQQRYVLRAEVHQRAQRRSGPALGPALEPPPGQQERRDARGRLEIDRVETVAARHGQLERVGHADLAGRAVEQGDQGPAVRRQHTQRDERVHRGRGMPEVEPRGPVERPGAPHHHRRRQRQRRPLPGVELQRGHHRQQHDRDGEQRGDDEPLLQPGQLRVRLLSGLGDAGLGRGGQRRGVPCGRDGGEQVVGGDRLGVGDPGLLGRVVDVGADAVELVELPLDPVGARRAGHAGDVELDVAGRASGRASGQVSAHDRPRSRHRGCACARRPPRR